MHGGRVPPRGSGYNTGMQEIPMHLASTPSLTLAFFNFTAWEMVIIAVILLLLFGRKMPDIARSVGKSIVEFKKGMKDVQTDVDRATTDTSGYNYPQQRNLPQGNPGPTSPGASQTSGNTAPQARQD